MVLLASSRRSLSNRGWFILRYLTPATWGDSMGENPSIVTVEFRELDSITQVATTIDFASMKDRDAALSTGMTDGMEMSYKKLADVVGELG